MLAKFWEEQIILVKITGSLVALGALFLNISVPVADEAKSLLANIQVFFLLIITVVLMVLFTRFIKYLVKEEKAIENKYKAPMIGTFSIASFFVLAWFIFSLWGYIISLYSRSFVQFLYISFPGIIIVGGGLFGLFIEKRREKFTNFSQIIINSFILSVLISVAGIYIQHGILKYFYHHWFFPVPHILFLIFFFGFSVLFKVRKRKLFAL